jgi:hypothetical protein
MPTFAKTQTSSPSEDIRPQEHLGGLTIRMRRLSVIEAEQLLRVVVQDLVGDFLR